MSNELKPCPVCGKVDLAHPAHTFRCHEIEELCKERDALQAKLDIAVEALYKYRASGTNSWADEALKKLKGDKD